MRTGKKVNSKSTTTEYPSPDSYRIEDTNSRDYRSTMSHRPSVLRVQTSDRDDETYRNPFIVRHGDKEGGILLLFLSRMRMKYPNNTLIINLIVNSYP